MIFITLSTIGRHQKISGLNPVPTAGQLRTINVVKVMDQGPKEAHPIIKEQEGGPRNMLAAGVQTRTQPVPITNQFQGI
jgi:hypothetical protein